MFAIASLLFFGTFSVHYSEGEDSPNWINLATTGSWAELLDQPHHIGFLPLCRATYRVAQSLGYAGDAGSVMRAMNALAGALSLALSTVILGRLNLSARLNLVWVATAAFTFGFWSYSTQPETMCFPCRRCC